jgi:Fe2+ or Zn2+ uptake regulation protein
LTDPREKAWPEAELEDVIRSYLTEHPQAMDTTEGIAEWWVMRQRVRADLETLVRVLQRLTDQGVLEQIGSGDNARYRLKKQNDKTTEE